MKSKFEQDRSLALSPLSQIHANTWNSDQLYITRENQIWLKKKKIVKNQWKLKFQSSVPLRRSLKAEENFQKKSFFQLVNLMRKCEIPTSLNDLLLLDFFSGTLETSI